MRTPFEAARDLARAAGMKPVMFAEYCKKHGLIRDDERVCHKCLEVHKLDSFRLREPNKCKSCRNEERLRYQAKIQERTLDAGASRHGALWEEWEEQWILDHLAATNEELAKKLGRHWYAVRKHKEDMGIDRAPKSPFQPTQFQEVRTSSVAVVTIVAHDDPDDEHYGLLVVYCNSLTTQEQIQKSFTEHPMCSALYEEWFRRVRP